MFCSKLRYSGRWCDGGGGGGWADDGGNWSAEGAVVVVVEEEFEPMDESALGDFTLIGS